MILQPTSPKMTSDPHTLSEWTNVLCNEDMPIFSNTALKIHDVLNDHRKGAMELASVILQDPNLTVKLLKISNSPQYNLSRQKMVTVSRAIIMIGSEVIRELTLVCSFFESILSSTNKQQANEEIAQAIHAAVHAKAIAIAANDTSPEEVFIATLLNHIGSISFWCFCGQHGERIQSLLNNGCSREAAEKQVLGFKLTDLSMSLSNAWKLGGLIQESIKPNILSKNPRIEFVELGYEITDALKEGTSSENYTNCIKKIAGFTRQSKQVIMEALHNNTEIASVIARQFGAADAALIIQNNATQFIEPEQFPLVIDKKQLQLQISQDITSIISDQININLLLETVLEGIHRGIGMDRTLFCLLGTDKQILTERLSLGWRKEFYEQKIVLNIANNPPNLFFHALSGKQAFWAKPMINEKLYNLRDINLLGKNECFMMPISSNNIQIGLIYTDRAFSGESLTEDEFNAFKYFAQQANIGLAMYRMQRS